MKQSTVRLTGCLALSLALAAGVTQANQEIGPITLDDLTRNALVIVEGSVESTSAAWNADRTQIHTTVRLKPDAFYKGDDGSAIVEIELLGGVVGEDGLAIIGQPEFRIGERVMVFLRADWKSNDLPVVQMQHGKFTIGTKAPGAEVLVNAAGESYAKSDVIAAIRLMNSAGTGGRP